MWIHEHFKSVLLDTGCLYRILGNLHKYNYSKRITNESTFSLLRSEFEFTKNSCPKHLKVRTADLKKNDA